MPAPDFGSRRSFRQLAGVGEASLRLPRIFLLLWLIGVKLFQLFNPMAAKLQEQDNPNPHIHRR